MTDADKIEYAVAAFEALVGEKQDRLQRGVILRQAMHDAIKRGETPQGYRPLWIREGALELVRHCQHLAEQFDLNYPDDKASVSDLLDLLATAANLFRKHKD